MTLSNTKPEADKDRAQTQISPVHTVAICAGLLECLGLTGGLAWAVSSQGSAGLPTRIGIVVLFAVLGAAGFALLMARLLRSRK